MLLCEVLTPAPALYYMAAFIFIWGNLLWNYHRPKYYNRLWRCNGYSVTSTRRRKPQIHDRLFVLRALNFQPVVGGGPYILKGLGQFIVYCFSTLQPPMFSGGFLLKPNRGETDEKENR